MKCPLITAYSVSFQRNNQSSKYTSQTKKENPASTFAGADRFEPKDRQELERRLNALYAGVDVPPEDYSFILFYPERMFSDESIAAFERKKKKYNIPLRNHMDVTSLCNTSERYLDEYMEIYGREQFDVINAKRFERIFYDSDIIIDKSEDENIQRARAHMKSCWKDYAISEMYNPNFLACIAIQNGYIEDEYIKGEINKKLEEFANSDFPKLEELPLYAQGSLIASTKLKEIYIIQNVVNQYNGIYTNIKRHYPLAKEDSYGINRPVYEDFITALAKARENEINIHTDSTNSTPTNYKQERLKISKRMASQNSKFANEMRNAMSTLPLEEYVSSFNDNKEMCMYLYKNYYLGKYPPKIQKDCIRVAQDFNTYIFLPLDYENTDINLIYDELSVWAKAAEKTGEVVNFPSFIKISPIADLFVRKKYSGFANNANKYIYIKNNEKLNIHHILRHELMHVNDKKSKKLDEIEQFDIVKFKQRKWFRKEFENNYKGDPKHINYAYRNRAEFVAVAAECETSKFSTEFKQILIELGMPHFVFELDKQ